ncbi:MAG: putative monovalent cation/H+ antiporter subunit A [Trichloromonadaceae bacterium]
MIGGVVAVFVLALAAPWLVQKVPQRPEWLLCLLPFGLTGFFLTRLGPVSRGEVLTESQAWVPSLGVSFSFYLDGLSLLFALLICGVGGLIVIYAGSYLEREPRLGRFYLWLLLFMAAMLGLVLAGNLITLFLFWELTSITSFFLIGFDDHKESSRAAALQALLVTGLGGLAMLAGFLLLGHASGSFELSALLTSGEVVRSHSLYLPILLLVLAGAFTKSAQFPFHFWLPAAMAAPTPVSAYLHSVTMVKAGVYLLFRLSPVLGGTAAWNGLLEVAGGTTMLVGAWLAFLQTDLKRILAYSTVSSLGTLVFLIGLDLPFAIEAALVYLLAHALYKGSLFLVAGTVDHATGSRDVTVLGGLFSRLPLLGVAAVVAAISMAGAPPLLGFIAKEHFYAVVLTAPRAAWLSSAAAILTSLLIVAAATVVAWRPFFGRPANSLGEPHGVPVGLWLGPVVLAALGLLLALFPGLVDLPLLVPAAGAVLGAPVRFELHLWHGFSWVLLLSAVTLAGGGVLAWRHESWRRTLQPRAGAAAWGPARVYDLALAGMLSLAGWQTRVLQNGRLRIYLLTIVGATVALVGFTLATRSGVRLAPGYTPIFTRDLVVASLVLAAAWVALRSGSRLVAIVAMGVVGYGVALIFVQFGAPDLAMTQFIIETMTVVLFVLVFHRLPIFSLLRGRKRRPLDGVVALGAGAVMTLLTLVVLTERQGSRVSGFFAEQSLPAAHGRNLVNVILVDFRALDTLGEIAVLALAGAGVLALLRLGLTDGRKG